MGFGRYSRNADLPIRKGTMQPNFTKKLKLEISLTFDYDPVEVNMLMAITLRSTVSDIIQHYSTSFHMVAKHV